MKDKIELVFDGIYFQEATKARLINHIQSIVESEIKRAFVQGFEEGYKKGNYRYHPSWEEELENYLSTKK